MSSYKNQHFVQVDYLKHWCVKGVLAVATNGRVLSNQSPRNHAQKDYYYKFVDLNNNELRHLFDLVATWLEIRD